MTEQEMKNLVNTISSLSSKEIDEIQWELRKQETFKKNEEIKAQAQKFESEYVGRCYKTQVCPRSGVFPSMWRYYKILNFRYQGNPYYAECLMFDEYPLYWFNYQAHKYSYAGDYFLGTTDFEGIHVDAIPFLCNNVSHINMHEHIEHFGDISVGKYKELFTEISLDEYNQAMDTYVNRLKKLHFTTNHARSCDRKPGDPGWEKEE